MIGFVVGKVKGFVMGVLALLSGLFGFLFLVQTLRYKNLEKEKEDLEEENRELKETVENISDDVNLVNTLRQKEMEIDKQTSEEVREIENASDSDILDRLNRMYD